MSIFRALLGLTVLLAFLFLLSKKKKAISYRMVASALLLQFFLAFLFIKVPLAYKGLELVSSFFLAIMSFAEEGSRFVFGSLVDVEKIGFIVAFKVLPQIIFVSALSSALYYFGILQKFVAFFAWIMRRVMKISGAEALAASANVFLGQTEAPLLVKPYIAKMTKSELLSLMLGGMATIAGAVFVAFIGILGGDDPVQQMYFAKHLLMASIISAPAALLCAKILIPETEKVDARATLSKDESHNNLLDAITTGTSEGLRLAVNVGAMLVVFIALIAMLNEGFAVVGNWLSLNDWVFNFSDGRYSELSLEFCFAVLFAPVAWVIGVPSSELFLMGQLLGTKTVVNEFVAYQQLGVMIENNLLSDKSILLATYALCGFANFSSIGIQLGGIGALVPERRKDLSSLAYYALIGGTVACLMTACLVGLFF